MEAGQVTTDETAPVKDGMRAAYAAGAYEKVAALERRAAARFVRTMGVAPAFDVLDVGTGTGNLAIPAARAGAHVVGLDLSPDQLELARRRATRAGVAVQWVEGDAESLPFPDASFDRVLSAFAVMFAPRHQRAADELLRVSRPGALIGVCSWTPGGIVGRLMEIAAAELPPPPPYALPPSLWGTTEHVEGLFARPGVRVSLRRDAVTYEFPSVAGYVEFFEVNFGPMVLAKQVLVDAGKWEDVREAMLDLLAERNEARNGSFRAPQEYLVAIAHIETEQRHDRR